MMQCMYCRCTFAISAVFVCPLPPSLSEYQLNVDHTKRCTGRLITLAAVPESPVPNTPDVLVLGRAFPLQAALTLHLLLDQLSPLHWLHSLVAFRILLHIISQCLCTPIIYVCASQSASVQILGSTFQNKSFLFAVFSIRK